MIDEPLLSAVLRALHTGGPQDLKGIVHRIETDPVVGHLALTAVGFEAQIRQCLKRLTPEGRPYFRQVNDYKWSIARNIEPKLEQLSGFKEHSPWLSLGRGTEIVYALFLPSSLSRISSLEKLLYPVKIGRTKRDVSNRFAELQTGNYEDLKIGILMRTDFSAHLESYLHHELNHARMLRRNNQTEWFLTSLSKIKELYEHYCVNQRKIS